MRLDFTISGLNGSSELMLTSYGNENIFICLKNDDYFDCEAQIPIEYLKQAIETLMTYKKKCE
jgi:hypothetical protein